MYATFSAPMGQVFVHHMNTWGIPCIEFESVHFLRPFDLQILLHETAYYYDVLKVDDTPFRLIINGYYLESRPQ